MKPGYKQTEVGVIPEDWEVKPLGDLLSKGRLGGNYPNQPETSGYPLMKMGNLSRGEFDISKIEFIKPGIVPESVHRLRHGDVLFNTRNTLDLVGKVAMWRDELPEAYYNSNLMRLEFAAAEICAPSYANAALNSQSSIALLRNMATGTTSVAAIYTRDLKGLPLAKPPLPEQRAIADALIDMDALIGALDTLIVKKRDLKQAAMQQLLTAQTRLPSFSKKWPVRRFGDLLKICHGRSQKEVESRDGAFPILATGGEIGRANRALHDKPSVLIGRKGTIDRPQFMSSPFWSVDTLFYSEIRDQNDAKFLFYCFCLIDWQQYNEASGVPSLNARTIEAIEVQCPNPAEQTAIAAVLSDMDAELATLEARREKTRALKQGMMQQLLTGQIRLV